MALMSPPILIAASTPVNFDLAGYTPSVNVAVHFFADAEGLTEVAAPLSGSRDVTATARYAAREGEFRSPGQTLDFVSGVNNGTISAMVSGTLYELAFGRGAQYITLVAAPNTDPAGSVSYRIIVDASGAGSSELG